MSLADVSGTDLLSRRALALSARSLALRGESLFLIRDELVPCSDWDVTTRNGFPRAYRVSVPEAGGPRPETALAGEVLHFRIGSDAVAPWTGTAPLRRASLSAQLLQELETALRDVFRDAPLGSQIVPVPEGSADDMAELRSGFRGRRGAALVIEGVAQATAAGMNPNIGKSPDQLSPDLSRRLRRVTKIYCSKRCCQKHYDQLDRDARREQRIGLTCQTCGKTFDGTIRNQKHCSLKCRRRAVYLRKKT